MSNFLGTKRPLCHESNSPPAILFSLIFIHMYVSFGLWPEFVCFQLSRGRARQAQTTFAYTYCLLPTVAALALFDFKRGPVVSKEQRQAQTSAQRPISIDNPISKFANTWIHDRAGLQFETFASFQTPIQLEAKLLYVSAISAYFVRVDRKQKPREILLIDIVKQGHECKGKVRCVLGHVSYLSISGQGRVT